VRLRLSKDQSLPALVFRLEFLVADEQTIQRRQHDRYAVTFPVSFSGKAAGRGQAMDLSVLGCAIDADQSVATQVYLKLELSLPDGDTPLEIELAVVRWSHGQQLGMEFIAFGEAQKNTAPALSRPKGGG
jgi:hypothetical protein